MDISFLTRREVSQPEEDVEGRVSSDTHRIYKTRSRAGCFCNMRNTTVLQEIQNMTGLNPV